MLKKCIWWGGEGRGIRVTRIHTHATFYSIQCATSRCSHAATTISRSLAQRLAQMDSTAAQPTPVWAPKKKILWLSCAIRLKFEKRKGKKKKTTCTCACLHAYVRGSLRTHACACTIREGEDTGEGRGVRGGDLKAYPEVNHNIAPIHKENPARQVRLGGHKALPSSIRTSAQHVCS